MQLYFLDPSLARSFFTSSFVIYIALRNLFNLIFFGFVLVVDEYPKDYVNAGVVDPKIGIDHPARWGAGKLTPREAGLIAHREAEEKILQAQQKIQAELEVAETMEPELTAEEKIKKQREDGLNLHRAAEEKILQAQREMGGLI